MNYHHETLNRIIQNVRRRIFFTGFCRGVVKYGLIVLPPAALFITLSNLQGLGYAPWIAVIASVLWIAMSLFHSVRGFGSRIESALSLDQFAHLKDRITSAYEFLEHEKLKIPETVQVQDAIRHARSLNLQRVIPIHYPRYSGYFPVVLLFFYLSLFVPPAFLPTQATAVIDGVKQEQLQELALLEEELLLEEEQPEELQELLDELRKMREKFEDGELSERDVMIELARMDQNLMQKVKEMGIDRLQGELNEIVPHLMSAAAAVQVANSIKENRLEKAAQELEKLGEKVQNNQLTEEEKRELAMNMGMVAAKLGGKQDGSFGGDFSRATQALESSDSKGFCSACQSIGDKLKMMSKAKKLAGACKSLGNCKACLGQSDGTGIAMGPKKSAQNGSKTPSRKAGTGVTGDPFGDGTRLNDSYRNMLRVTGQAGNGPVETEIEITEGQLSKSQVEIKEIHENFAQVAEEAMENDAVPLSHRYHVKRYFQSIRPVE